MNSLLMIMLIGFVFVVTFYFVYEAGFKDGHRLTFQAYIKEWVEIKQRVKDETWKDLQQAYSVIDDRKRKLNARQKK